MLEIAGKQFGSHLIMGTGGASSFDMLEKALAASGTELTTVSLRRTSLAEGGGVLGTIRELGIMPLPNTATTAIASRIPGKANSTSQIRMMMRSHQPS